MYRISLALEDIATDDADSEHNKWGLKFFHVR